MKNILFASLIFALLFLTPGPALAGEPPPELSARPRWQQLFPPTSPPSRPDTAMAYDPVRKVGVIFGGSGGGFSFDETWEWDSLTMTWIERFPAHRPPPRFGAAMVYDAARDEIVMFGGVSSVYEEFSDTWVWDGTDWTQVFPVNSPSPRWLHGMIYDSQRQVVVLFGGLKDSTNYDDTWEWDGSNWTEQTIAAPPRRHGMALAYDTRRGVTVLFGGDDSFGPTYFDDTWERAGGGDWYQVFPTTHPEARQRMDAAYFSRLGRTIVYGGYNFDGTRLGDTWAWDGQNWLKPNLNLHPTGGAGGMVYDSRARGLVLYVGISQIGELVSETWLFR